MLSDVTRPCVERRNVMGSGRAALPQRTRVSRGFSRSIHARSDELRHLDGVGSASRDRRVHELFKETLPRCAVDANGAYVQQGNAVSAQEVEQREILGEATGRRRIRETRLKPRAIDTTLRGKGRARRRRELARLEERAHEVLVTCVITTAERRLDAHRGTRRGLGVWMPWQRDMTHNDTNTIVTRSDDLAKRRVRPSTMRTLKVREDDDRGRPRLHSSRLRHLVANRPGGLSSTAEQDDAEQGAEDHDEDEPPKTHGEAR